MGSSGPAPSPRHRWTAGAVPLGIARIARRATTVSRSARLGTGPSELESGVAVCCALLSAGAFLGAAGWAVVSALDATVGRGPQTRVKVLTLEYDLKSIMARLDSQERVDLRQERAHEEELARLRADAAKTDRQLWDLKMEVARLKALLDAHVQWGRH